MQIDNAFLIVKKFPKLYNDHVERYKNRKNIYAIPRIDKNPEESKIKYRGVDRDALSPLSSSDIKYIQNPLLAEVWLDEIEKESKSCGGYIFDEEDALDVYNFLEEKKKDYEIIWVRLAGSNTTPPKEYQPIGYESSYFFPESYSPFSPSCDCMLIPRWHGTDKEGKLFINYFKKLNSSGLFGSPREAEEFLSYYLSFDWTERGEFKTVEVFIKTD